MSATEFDRRSKWLNAAISIGERIVRQAKWSAEECSWDVWISKGVPGLREGHWVAGGPTLYQGAAGTALFLAELYRVTGNDEFLRVAKGAMAFSAQRGMAMSSDANGFHSGRVGIAYTAYRLAISSGDDSYLHQATALLEPLDRYSVAAEPGDVIGGAAGAVPALLNMRSQMPSRFTTDVAQRMGESILSAAKRRVIGWSWGGVESAVDDLVGYSHGAAGYAHAMAELLVVTGDSRYLYGVQQAHAYESSRFDATLQNWPDLRHFELSEYSVQGGREMLRSKLRSGFRIPEYKPTAAIMWCHGAPGIGLERARCFELFGDPVYAAEALLASRTTRASIRSEGNGYSLCHGHLGNCETLLTVGRLFENSDLLSVVEARVQIGIDKHENTATPWPCGTVGGVADPSLMVGEAGIGYFMLRLSDRSTPNILCLRGSEGANSTPIDLLGAEVLKREHVEQFFGDTLREMERMHIAIGPILSTALSDSTPLAVVQREVQHYLENEKDARVMHTLKRAFSVEERRYEMEQQGHDYSREYVRSLSLVPFSGLPLESTRFYLRNDVVLSLAESLPGDVPDPSAADYDGDPHPAKLLFSSGRRVRAVTLNDFAALVMSAMREPSSFAEIVCAVRDQVDFETSDVAGEQLQRAIRHQIESAYRSGLLDVGTSQRPEAANATAHLD